MTRTIDHPPTALSDLPPLPPREYTPTRVTNWLRTSGGTMGERALKFAAADLIESMQGADETQTA